MSATKMQNVIGRLRTTALCVILTALSAPTWAATWTTLTNQPPTQIYQLKLLTDGTVMAESGEGPNWLRFTPDATGSYINGTWSSTSINPMSTRRFSYATEILPSGKVWIFGGENYGPNDDYVWNANGEIWDPISNTWSPVATFPPQSCFSVTYNVTGNTTSGSPVITNLPTVVTPTFLTGWTVSGTGIPSGSTITSVDSSSQVHISNNATSTQTGAALQFAGVPTSCYGDVPSMLLPGGQILTGSLAGPGSYIYTIATNSWAFAANKVYSDSSDEEGWMMAVEPSPVMIGEPAVVFPVEITGEGPASATNNTCPFGMIAPGASSAPKRAELPLSLPKISGPAAHVLVEGV